MRYVDSAHSLTEACDACSAASLIGIDTEFERSRTFFARPALVQIFDGRETWLLDPVAVEDLTPLRDTIEGATPLKVMHSALEDLAVLELTAGAAPRPLFDTQLAAAFAGLGFGLGYDRLVDALLGVTVSKSQTRSDWMRRPLSAAQLEYAVADVRHLPDLHRCLDERLQTLERSRWLAEETALACDPTRNEEPGRSFERLVRGIEDDAHARGALHSLCAWREREARTRDLPRRHLADDPLIVALAHALPGDRAELQSLPAYHEHRGRARTDSLLEAASQARNAPPRELPPGAHSLAPYQRALQCMKNAVSRTAADLNLPPALLASRRLLEKLVVHAHVLGQPGLPEELEGWRAPLLKERLMECLNSV